METVALAKWPSAGVITPLTLPVSFTLLQNEKPITATITHVENGYLFYLYHITFSDTRKAEFFYDTEEEQWIEESVGPTELAETVGSEMKNVSVHLDKGSCYTLWPAFEIEPYNVWLLGNRDGGYDIAYKGKIEFSMEKAAVGWQRDKKLDGGRYVDPNIETFVKHHLDQTH